MTQPTVRFVTSEEWVEVYVDDRLFDANLSIGRLDLLGLLRKVGCVVQKVEATKPLKQRTSKLPPAKKSSAKPTAVARRKTKRGT